MKVATAEPAGGARSAIKRGQRGWRRSRGESHDWQGRQYLAVFLSHQCCDRGMSANHRVYGRFLKPGRETRSLLDQLRDGRDAVSFEEFTSRGESFLWLFVEEILKWVIAAPGSTLSGSRLDTWCWRLQHYDSAQESLLRLADIEELVPAAVEWSRSTHARALEGLKRLHVDEVGNLEVLITELQEELRVAEEAHAATPPAAQERGWIPRGLDFRPVAVKWLSTPGLAAGSGKTLTVGEEHAGRFRVAFVTADATAEAEVDLKRSMVTVHPIEGQPQLLVAGRSLDTKLSLAVTDSAMGENPPELRTGKQLGDELERVVCIG